MPCPRDLRQNAIATATITKRKQRSSKKHARGPRQNRLHRTQIPNREKVNS
jgi:hypothetical protein